MAKVFTGKDGVLRVGGNDQVKVTSWSLQAEIDLLETTTLGDNDRSFTPGLRSYNGTATLLYYQDDAGRNDAASLIKQVVSTGEPSSTPVSFTFRLKDGLSFRDITLNAFIASVTYAANVGEIVNAQVSFRGTGAVAAISI